MIQIVTVDYPAFGGTEPRRVYVYLPTGYEKDETRRYPVLYMFDGHNVFYDSHATYGKSWGLGRYLSTHHIPLMVVAVECNHGLPFARVQEYCPYDFTVPEDWLPEEERGQGDRPVTGYGDATLDWFTTVLKPQVDKAYRTLPEREHTFLMGSSMGGLMGIHAILHYGNTFSRVCALSPAVELWADQLMEDVSTADPVPGGLLYMDYGTSEEDYERAVDVLGAAAAVMVKKDIYQTLRTVPGGIHNEATWERSLPFCIQMLMQEYR